MEEKTKSGAQYIPGFYGQTRPNKMDLVDSHFAEWEKSRRESQKRKDKVLPPCICISRKIGVGALEIADIIHNKTGFWVVDREIISAIAESADLSEKTVKIFDERYPGGVENFVSMLFRQKSFVQSDYLSQMAKAVNAISANGPIIFVGRGAHLVLPRERVLAVRLISSDEYRIKRLGGILSFDESEKGIRKNLSSVDKEQAQYFQKNFNKKTADPYEFDLVINRDFFGSAANAAGLIENAFNYKFENFKA